MFSPQPPRVVASHRGIAHVSLVKTHKSLLLHGAGSTDGPVSRVIARVGSRPAGPAATSTAAATAAAAPYPAATAAAGRTDCALSRRAIGAGIDRIDLSARNNIGGALGGEESDPQGPALEDAMQKEPWDPSVKGLTSVPQVLAMMNDKLDWTSQLGEAFLAQ